MNDIQKPFDRNLVRLHRDRAAKDRTFDDFLENEVAERLADRLLDIKREFSSVLVLGCKRGRLTKLVRALLPNASITQGDLSPAMVELTSLQTGIPAVVIDEENLEFADHQFDLVISNLSLHWVNDLPGCLLQIGHKLKPDGLFLASLIGGDSLASIRSAFLEAEMDLTGGASPRFSPVLDLREAAALLQRVGLALPVADLDRINVSYGTGLKLLHDLRGMGEVCALNQGIKHFTSRSTLMAALAKLEVEKDQNGRLPVNFDILFLTGWRPDSSQQQPLRPGSAKSRLADALGSFEHGLNEPTKPS